MKVLLAVATLVCCGSLFAQPQPLFNGKDLTGWQMVGPGRFEVEDGMLKTVGGMGLLWYKDRKLGNETLRIVFKTTGERDNSGVVIRLPAPPPDPWYGVHNGYEVQIDAAGDEWHRTGALYSLSRSTKATQKPIGEWNTMEIELEGQTTRVKLNGELVNEFEGNQKVPERKAWYEPVRGPRPDKGFIGLQNHDPRTTVYFREVSVIPTDQSPLPLRQGDRDRLLSYMHATRKQIVDAVTGLSPEQWKFKPAPEKWSIAEVVEHLALTEDMLFNYALGALQHSAPAPTGERLTTEQLVKGMADRSKPVNAPGELRPTGRWQVGAPLTAEFGSRRDRMVEWVRDTREPLQTSYASWGPGTTVDVYQLMNMIPAHTERHFAQIMEVKSNSGFPQK
jgi:hypothetical protein